MKILITNDDGIASPNLKLLVEEAIKHFPGDEIIVLAPAEEQSAVSHRINIFGPIYLNEERDIVEGIKTYSINSTPADCVKFAIHSLHYDFDLCLSGINNGLNLGEDIVYSGTVGAALEAAMYHKYSLALSCHFYTTEGFQEGFEMFLKEYRNNPIYKEHLMWNVNFPPNPKGLKYCFQGKNDYQYAYNLGEKEAYYPKAKKGFVVKENEFATDLDCFHQGYVSITPLTYDMTAYDILKKTKPFAKDASK